MSAGGELTVRQARSLIGADDAQRATVRSLGLRRVHDQATHPDRPEIRGMIARVAHLVTVTAADGRELDVQPGQRPGEEG